MRRSTMQSGVQRLRRLLAVSGRQHESDEQLLHAFTTRPDDSAFAVLVHRHGPMVLHVCRRVLNHEQDAEDAFQATFLVLAQSAAALRNKASLAGYLHRIAQRTALKAKYSTGQRRKYEAQAPIRSNTDPADEITWRDVRALLDEEIARLPEKYRTAFVLCCLEELSQAEAARCLSVNERTLSSRLATARKRLSQRLAHRGVELTALLAASTLAAQQASALSPMLTASTIQAALAMQAGEKIARIASSTVAALFQGMATTLMVSKAKLATAIVLVVSVLSLATGGVLVRWHEQTSEPLAVAPEPPAAKTDDKPKAAKPQRETTKTVEIHGRVLSPDGKPKAGAKLLLGRDKKLVELGVTAADGRFTISVPKAAKYSYLIARTNDTDFDIFGISNWQEEKQVEMRLVKDQPIRGRILNTEGKPLAGVYVAARNVNFYPNNSLDRFLSHWKNLQVGLIPLGGGYGMGDEIRALFATTTDAEGRFVLRGLGEERFIPLRLSGTGLADSELWVVTRPHFDPKPFNQAVLDNTSRDRLQYLDPGRMLHGPDLTFVVEPEKILRGIVKEAGTGKGRPNVPVSLYQRRGGEIKARTDAEGRYEIRRARKAKSYELIVPSDPIMGHVGSRIEVEDTPGYQPVAVDITVKKGVVITGKMIDQATRKPVNGMMRVAVLNDNPFVKDYPGFGGAAWYSFGATAPDGVFRIVSIPGPVLLVGGPRDGSDEKYKRSIPDPEYRRYFRAEPNGLYYYPPGGGFSPILGVFFKVLEIKPDAKVIEQDVILERLPVMTVQMQDADGKPLTLAYVAGITDQGGAQQFGESSCTVYGVQPGKPRGMIFYHPLRKLAGTITLKGNEKQPVIVKLRPAGTIEGRLLDADGKALAGVRIYLNYHHDNANSMQRCIRDYRQFETDAQGAFRFEDAIPGIKFELSFRRGRQRLVREAKSTDPAIQLQSGERRDLGAIRLKPQH